MLPQGRVKASDVANAAGVSVATVSYVLNQTPGQRISRETADRVRAAAKELGYVSNRAAQNLARGDSRLVVIDLSCIPDGPATEEGTSQFNSRIESLGYTAIQSWWGPQSSHEQLLRLVTNVGATRVLTALPPNDETRRALHSAGVQTISSLLPHTFGHPTVVESSASIQIDHLADQGHTHILHALGYNPDQTAIGGHLEAAGRERAEELGLQWTALPPSRTLESYASDLGDALRKHPSTTAIATTNDVIALQTLTALSQAGRSVPDEIAVIGVGNLNFTPFTDPPLSTVAFSYHLDQLPKNIFEMMLEGPGMDGIATTFGGAVAAHVIQRDSTTIRPYD